jgi:hypothetical protein
MNEEKKKRRFGFFYVGSSVELDGYKTDRQVKVDRKWRRLSQGFILIIVLVVAILLFTQDLLPYWFQQLRDLVIFP